jgi:hypothetical protein
MAATMGEIEIITLSTPFDLIKWGEICIYFSLNIVLLQPSFYHLRSKLPRILVQNEYK